MFPLNLAIELLENGRGIFYMCTGNHTNNSTISRVAVKLTGPYRTREAGGSYVGDYWASFVIKRNGNVLRSLIFQK